MQALIFAFYFIYSIFRLYNKQRGDCLWPLIIYKSELIRI